MSSNQTVDILKNAILLERRGTAFYKKVADQSSNPAVKDFFEMMADEEAKHIKILSDQFQSYHTDQRFMPLNLEDKHASNLDTQILNKQMMAEIAAAGFEAAAVAAAIAMEERAVKLYAERASSASDPEEKALYQWLANWERGHLQFLSELDRQLTENVWFDNHFWPF